MMMMANIGSEVFLDNKSFLAEPKLDGVRALAEISHPIAHVVDEMSSHRSPPTVRIFGRSGEDYTKNFPEIENELKKTWIKGTTILDGEIVYLEESNNTFKPAHQRVQVGSTLKIELLSQRYPLTYVVFDILAIDGKDVRIEPLMVRKNHLNSFFERIESKRIQKIWYTFDRRELFERVKKTGGEGIMLKHVNSYYIPRRNDGWLKLKVFKTEDCIVTGFTQGEGSRKDTFGALELHQYHQGKLVYVGKCGTGFSDQELKELMKLPLPFVVEVKYLQRETSLKLRHPSYLRVRFDKKLEECKIVS